MQGLPPFEGPPPNMDSPVIIYSEYFADLTDMLTNHFPEGNIGENRGFVFHSDYVIRNNKRTIVFFVTHGPADDARIITRITYVLPANRNAAKIFNLEGADPPVAPVYNEMAVPAGSTLDTVIADYVAANNLASWRGEITRVSGLEAAAPEGKLRRACHNIVHYWRDMRTRLQDAIFASPIHMPFTSSGNLRSSERRRRSVARSAGSNPVRRTSSPRIRSKSARPVRGPSSSDPRSGSNLRRQRRLRRMTARVLTPSSSNSSPRKTIRYRRPSTEPE
jgi:hypothetical protein